VKEQPLVSIIIPTYNRAHLIGETLDSILAQTYQNWECLVIDDGSEDDTDEVLNKYCKKEGRFYYFKRPSSKPKGANACRNMGLEQAKGAYVIFFDSDDLMTPDHVAVKVEGVQKANADYAITRTAYFNAPNKSLDHYYTFGKVKLTPHNYILQKINWLTLDICVKQSVISTIRFNETLQSGQEYNFFSKLIVRSSNGVFIDKVVSLRRYHTNSIQENLKRKSLRTRDLFLTQWATLNEVFDAIQPETRKGLLYICIEKVFMLKKVPENNLLPMIIKVFQVYGFMGFNFIAMYFLRKYFNRGYGFRSRLKP